MDKAINRRDVLRGASLLGRGMALSALLPAWARSATPGLTSGLPTVSGREIALTIDELPFTVSGYTSRVVAVNGTVPAPLVRLKEGQTVRLVVTNKLDEDSSIHWHGVLVPFQFDGVPGVSFPGIKARSTFVYEFPVKQSGTYWYHSHTGLQEQAALYGPIVIDPAGPDPVAYDREHVIVLSDWSPLDPHMIMDRLKKGSGYFNFQRQTLTGLLAGRDQTLKERLTWVKMRMDPTDMSDVTGSTYTYLVNGHGPFDNWTALFHPGERVRLRIVNASAMTFFNVRIPGLPMSVVQADGQNVRPVSVDEFQIGVAETYDVIVRPTEDKAFTFVAEAIDRSGMGRATLAPRLGMAAPVPPLRKRPIATMEDMGMGGMNMGSAEQMKKRGMDPTAERNASAALAGGVGTGTSQAISDKTHGAMGQGGSEATMGGGSMAGMDHGSITGMDHGSMGGMAMGNVGHGGMSGMDMDMRNPANAPQVKMTPSVQTISPMPMDRTGYPGMGLEDVGHKVLAYTDLVALDPNPDPRPPSRSMEIHLTGNMERYMWSFDGLKFNEVKDPIPFRRDERVRVTLVNDTMMAHPIHLHGHFFEVVNGHPGRHPRKHTVNVQPGGKVSFDLTADAPGDWAFHCHLLYHMHAGMFQVVTVRPLEGAAT